MPDQQLRRLLHQLQAELQHLSSQGESADASVQEQAQQIQSELRSLLQQMEAGSIPSAQPHRLRESLAQFETSHPQLTLILEQVIDTLAGMGI